MARAGQVWEGPPVKGGALGMRNLIYIVGVVVVVLAVLALVGII